MLLGYQIQNQQDIMKRITTVLLKNMEAREGPKGPPLVDCPSLPRTRRCVRICFPGSLQVSTTNIDKLGRLFAVFDAAAVSARPPHPSLKIRLLRGTMEASSRMLPAFFSSVVPHRGYGLIATSRRTQLHVELH